MAGAGAPAADGSSSGLGFLLRAFRYRNYRLFFGGQIVSLVGTWITLTSTSWLVYRLTGSAFLLGVIGFASQFPSFILTPFAGIFVDRWNRHRLLVGTQIESMLISFALAGLTDVDAITLSMADYARSNSVPVAATAITLAALSNTVVKAGMVVSLGGPELRRPVLLASAALILVGVGTVVAMRCDPAWPSCPPRTVSSSRCGIMKTWRSIAWRSASAARRVRFTGHSAASA